MSTRSRTPHGAAPLRRTRGVGRSLWWLVLPAAMTYVVVVIVPSIQGTILSFTDWSAFSLQRTFNGLDNYIAIFRGDAGGAVLQTLIIALATMLLMNAAGLLLALVLDGKIFGRHVLRTLIFAPVIVSPLVCGFLFKYIFGPPGIGAVNDILVAIGLGSFQQVWLGDPQLAIWVVILVVVWQFTGSAMVIYLAGLQAVPAEVLEAAALDGAGSVAKFWYVTRAYLAPAITINLMLSLIGGLKIFDQIYATTQGGPAGSTETISTLIYKQFSMLGEYGQASALAVLLAIAVAIFSSVQFRVLRSQKGA
ncbi:raffinose/stachyose/melibiose transport system permease protein [Microbacterium sp. cf046]|uniref:carbohydrate ABC transporter permease n=1 Tax=Microbacterium sp. cf046 TaxID=1761803 RepID=UPI0008EA83B3|nr:sugar ABC transporter permease [Microbacterium sp. cf046]SFS16892.1 raffinose/stachyose/melibiose transport system permease protein [Microbacterium sp. cf046]